MLDLGKAFLSESVVLVSGAFGQIGSAVCKDILRAGGKVVLLDVDCSRLREVYGEYDQSKICVVEGDCVDIECVDHAIRCGVHSFGRLNAGVHAAYPRSESWGTAFEQLRSEPLFEDLGKQLGGSILFSQRLLRHLSETGGGKLIHISSIMGVCSPKFEAYAGTKMNSPIEYAAIKAGVIAITKYLAKYYTQQNIQVNCVSPGGIVASQPLPFIEKYNSFCNSKGLLDSEDVANCVLYLLAKASDSITGQNFIIDDGWSL